MSRILKFRAWDRVEKNMRYGFKVGEYATSHNCEPFQQFTGILDNNGVEIYEGDIIRSEKNGDFEICEVKWLADHLGFGMWWYDNPEVIGNIYENPELLTP